MDQKFTVRPQMPVVDGLEAIKIIRQTPNIQHIPIIALTANAEQADVDACIAAGMDDHSGKPMIPKEIIAKINGYVSQTKTGHHTH